VIAEPLQADGIKAFASSLDQLVATLGEKRHRLFAAAAEVTPLASPTIIAAGVD
jgi:hypothetical protein